MTTNNFTASLFIVFFACIFPFQSNAQFENTLALNTIESNTSIIHTQDDAGEISEYIIIPKTAPTKEIFNKALNIVIKPGAFKADYWIEYTNKNHERQIIRNEEILNADEQIVFTLVDGATNIKVFGASKTGRPGLPKINISNMDGKKIVKDCTFSIKGSFNNPKAEFKEH